MAAGSRSEIVLSTGLRLGSFVCRYKVYADSMHDVAVAGVGHGAA